MSDLPKIINIGCGNVRAPNALNVDIDPSVNPDMVVDISKPLDGILPQNYFEIIAVHDVLEHIPDLVSAMTNCLNLLKEDGMMDIIVPYDLSYGAWQDPTHVRAFNEKSWLYYYDWAWYLKWKEFGLKMVQCKFFVIKNTELIECQPSTTPRAVDVIRVYLKKTKVPDTK